MSKRSTTSKRKDTRFDPISFLKTAAKGRIVSTHPKKQIIFSAGRCCGFSPLYSIGKGQSHRRIPARQGSRCGNPGSGRILR